MVKVLVQRKAYLERLWGAKDVTEVVKVITGMRRCGKSVLLKQFADRLRENGVSDILLINFESREFDKIVSYKELNNYFADNLDPGVRTYVLLDEVQRVDGWERSINSLQADYDADVYVTGSNACLLSSELATYLSGRYIEIRMLPLSFSEYLVIHPADGSDTVDSRFMKYVSYGAIPMIDPDNEELTQELLDGIYSTVLRKDVSQRLGALDLRTIDSIVSFLMSNIGSVTSCASIADGLSLSPVTVKRYLQGLEDAYLVYKAPRYDVRGKRLLKSTEKYYAADTGLRNVVLRSSGGTDLGHMLENVVYLELVRRGYQVTVGCYYDKEVDFIAEKGGVRRYYQVSLSVLQEGTFDREVRSLKSLPDNFRKTVLTLDRVFPQAGEGIDVRNIVDWILESED